MNTTLNEMDTPTETEKRKDIMEIENKNQVQAPSKNDYLVASDLTAEIKTTPLNIGNDNVSENNISEEICAPMNEPLHEGNAVFQDGGTESPCHKVTNDGLNSSTILEDAEETDIFGFLQNQVDVATGSLRKANSKIQEAEDLLAFTKEQKHTLIYSTFRDMAFAACYCADNMEESAEQFGETWINVKPQKYDKVTGKYRHALNYISAKSGVSRERLIGGSTLSMYAGIIEFIHEDINQGKTTWGNFIGKVCRAHGGIHGFSKYAKMKNAKKNIKAGKNPKTGKALTAADADKKFNKDFESIQRDDSANDGNQRQLVSVVFDLSKSKNFPSLAAMHRLLSAKDYPEILAIKSIDDVLLTAILEGEPERGEITKERGGI